VGEGRVTNKQARKQTSKQTNKQTGWFVEHIKRSTHMVLWNYDLTFYKYI
jgi:hypothetical protein